MELRAVMWLHMKLVMLLATAVVVAASTHASSDGQVLPGAPAPPLGVLSLPRGPKLACTWDSTSATLAVSWSVAIAPPPLAYPADVYEIQISASPFARASAIWTVSGLESRLGLDVLLPNSTYFLSLRAHAGWAFATGHLMGSDTWGNLGPATACTTGAAARNSGTNGGVAGIDRVVDDGSSNALDTFTFESWRMSEYAAGEIDYLLNHDGADAAGSSLLLTALAQYEYHLGNLVLQDSWLGGSTSEVVLTAYCIEALRPAVPGNDTTGGDRNFADYLSCNNQADKTSATCSCAVPTDRLWGRLALSEPACKVPIIRTPCPADGGDGCTCTCTPRQNQTSAGYTGMMNVFAADDEDNAPVGRWYSHPAGAACRSNEKLGTVRPDGSRCTWKQSPFARTIRGWQLYAAGLNASGLAVDKLAGCLTNAPSCSPVAAQIQQNVAVMKSVLDSAPLAPWKCGAN